MESDNVFRANCIDSFARTRMKCLSSTIYPKIFEFNPKKKTYFYFKECSLTFACVLTS